MVSVISKIPELWQFVGAMATTAVVSSGLTVATLDVRGAPAQSAANTSAIEHLDTRVSAIERQQVEVLQELTIITCLLVEVDGMEPLEAHSFCENRARSVNDG